VNRATLASASPRRVTIGPVVDRRRETRLGVDPERKKDIVARRPVADIVRDALALEIGANGHALDGAGGADVALAADVEEFRLDVVRGYSNAQFVGKIVLALAVTDARTGTRLLDRRYVGIHRREAELESETAGREALDTALARTMHDLATDPDLARAFARAAAR
jgi:uncharacterized lipoprotein YajG